MCYNQKMKFRVIMFLVLTVITMGLIFTNTQRNIKEETTIESNTNTLDKTKTQKQNNNIEIPDISKTSKEQIVTRDKLIAMLDKNDSDTVYKVVDAIQADDNISTNCHDMAHDIGHMAYKMYGFAGAINFSKSDPTVHRSVQDICAGGYIHGVLEEAALYKPDFRTDPGAMCTDVNISTTDNCYHGVGHAIMYTYNRDIKPSLESCRTTGYIAHHTRCFEGVWMELFWGRPTATSSDILGFDLKQPLATCIATDNDAKPACFLYSVLGYLRSHKANYVGAIDLCTKNKLNDSDMHFCLKGVGIMMVRNIRENKTDKIEALVRNLNDEQKLGFYKGMLNYAKLAGQNMEYLDTVCNNLKTDMVVCKESLE